MRLLSVMDPLLTHTTMEYAVVVNLRQTCRGLRANSSLALLLASPTTRAFMRNLLRSYPQDPSVFGGMFYFNPKVMRSQTQATGFQIYSKSWEAAVVGSPHPCDTTPEFVASIEAPDRIRLQWIRARSKVFATQNALCGVGYMTILELSRIAEAEPAVVVGDMTVTYTLCYGKSALYKGKPLTPFSTRFSVEACFPGSVFNTADDERERLSKPTEAVHA